MNSMMDVGLITGKLGRIADALERIADALEKDKSPFYPVPAYPTPNGTGDPMPDEFIVTCESSQLGSPGISSVTYKDTPSTPTGDANG